MVPYKTWLKPEVQLYLHTFIIFRVFDKRAVVLIQTSIMSSEETLLSFEFCLSAFKRHIGELVSFI